MARIKIITDSTAYLSKEFTEKENITVVALNYIFGDETNKEPFPGEFNDFYNKLSTTKLFPTTSQPSTGDFYEAYQEAFNEGYDTIIVIVLSSKLSGTYNSAMLAKDMMENKNIYVIDSLNAAANMKFLVEDALDLSKKGNSPEDIEEYLNAKKEKMHVYLTTETLEYLSRGGRLSSVQATVGNLLNIKPVIELKDGQLGLLEKARGKNKAIASIMDKLPSNVEKISVCHAVDIEYALKLRDTLKDKFPDAIISIEELGPVIGSHLGAKGIGVCFY